METRNVLFVGLGSMGLGMARSLIRSGHNVFGTDLDPARVDLLVKAGGHRTKDKRAAKCDILVSAVLNAAQTRAILFGATGLAEKMPTDSVIVSCATVPPEFALEMEAEAKSAGLYYLDAPISGGAIKAAQGQLSIMASGSDQAFAAAEPALSAMATSVHKLGTQAGAGSAMKSVNQLLAGVHIAAMGEALAFGVSQGLDIGQIIKVISQSAGTSWMFENRAPHVRDNDYAPRSSVNIWPKDLGIVSEIASDSSLPVPMTQTALSLFRAAAKAGMGQEDDAAVFKICAQAAGLTPPGES